MALAVHGQAQSAAFPKVSDKVKMFELMSPPGAVTNDPASIGSTVGCTTPTTAYSPLSLAADSAIDWDVFEMLSPMVSPVVSPCAPPALPDLDVMTDLEDAAIDWAVFQLLGGGGPDMVTISEDTEDTEYSTTDWRWDVVDRQVFEMLGGGGPEISTTIASPEPSKTGWRWDDVDWQTFDGWNVFAKLSCSKASLSDGELDEIDWDVFRTLGSSTWGADHCIGAPCNLVP
jgi:hypothetical protein